MLMVDYMARPVIHEAFFKKYAHKKFLKGTLSYFSFLSPAIHVSNNTCSVNSHSPMVEEECPPLRHRRYSPDPQ